MSPNNDPVEPIPFDAVQPVPAPMHAPSRQDPTKPEGTPRWVVPALGILFAMVVAVVVWLPATIEPDTATPEPAAATATTPGASTDTANSTEPVKTAAEADAAPWSDAQAARLRREAQETATELLDLQFELQEKGVEQWATEDFAQVEQLANDGDDRYQERQYEEANTLYKQGLTSLQAIQAGMPERLKQLLAQAREAIEQGDQPSAEQALQLAALIEPEHTDIAELQRRVAQLPQILALLEQAAATEAEDDLASAEQLLKQASGLDPLHRRAASELNRVAELSRKRAFNAAMSEGYAALDEGNYDSARQAFRQAAKLQPESAEASSALQEVAAAETARRLTNLDSRGRRFEQKEQWQKAVEAYEQAQKTDSSVLFAREGLQRSRGRAQLDKQLRDLIEQPGRLSEPAVANGATQLLSKARNVAPRGPVLSDQVKTLETLLAQANTTVAVTLRSDSQTEVIVYKVARLGRFNQRDLTLRPGTYTAVGTRDGYRDVRQSFTVAHDSTPATVTIVCSEPI